MFSGKTDLKILELMDNKGTLLNKGKNVPSFLDIRLLPSGHLLVHEDNTLDLVTYDTEFIEVRRLPRATNGHNPFQQTYKTIKHGTSQNFYGWFAGNDDLRIVSLNSGDFTFVDNFFGVSGQKVVPLAVAMSDRERKAAGLYYVQNPQEVTLALMAPNGTVNRCQVDALCKHPSRLLIIRCGRPCLGVNYGRELLANWRLLTSG